MTYQGYGRVIKGVGGLFTVRLMQGSEKEKLSLGTPSAPLDGETVMARGRGALHKKGSLLVGDLVEVAYEESAYSVLDGVKRTSADGGGISIERILERRCALIRPPMANLEVLFITLAAASPDPILETVDKLICIAEQNRIEPVIVITKCDLNAQLAQELTALYRQCGFTVFCTGQGETEAIGELQAYIDRMLCGKIAAFAGASGVGKSTLLNRLFPSLSLQTGEISRRIERGKNTTRCVELYPLSEQENCGFLADTPGFTMLDFERFDFLDKEELPDAFREFAPYIGTCRYTKCSHTGEQGCAILEAVRKGAIPRSRHRSFCALYDVLKKKTKWDK